MLWSWFFFFIAFQELSISISFIIFKIFPDYRNYIMFIFFNQPFQMKLPRRMKDVFAVEDLYFSSHRMSSLLRICVLVLIEKCFSFVKRSYVFLANQFSAIFETKIIQGFINCWLDRLLKQLKIQWKSQEQAILWEIFIGMFFYFH